MLSDGSSGLDDRATIVVADSRSARQWEALLAARHIASGTAAWITPATYGYRAWTERLWLDGTPEHPPPLTHSQAEALWRRVIGESAAGAELIGHHGAASWAAHAWELLNGWQIDPDAQRAGGHQHDFRAFLGWCTEYRAVLADHGWIDGPMLDAALLAAPLPPLPAEVVLAELDEPPPARRALFTRLGAAGARMVDWRAPPAGVRARRVRLADSAAELAAAVAWCRERLRREPAARLALVVAGLTDQRGEVERVLAELGRGGSAVSLAGLPSIGAAVTGLQLLTAGATFATFSRWLRSPFFGSTEPAERATRARLEIAVRDEVRANLPFAVAYRHAGLREKLSADAPSAAAALASAFAELGDVHLAAPSRWARLWQRALAHLGWTAPGGAADPDWLGWQAALDELGRLTPILGELPARRALDELERILEQPRTAPPTLAGVHVYARVEDVGPGYAAAWLTGFTDTYWPEPQRANPLLPLALQRAHALPHSTPQDGAARSARSLDRLLRFVPDVVVSWPNMLYDYEAEPSPSIRAWPELPATERDTLKLGSAPPRKAPPARETLADPAPPLRGAEIRGGAGMVGRQARCPVRAFCEYRLAARALEPVRDGLSARHRGIVVHRALELLLRGLPSQAAHGALGNAVADCAQRALDHVFREARAPLRVLFDLERERLESLLIAVLQADTQRAPFKVLAVEQRQDLKIGPWTLSVRIDRLDRLADGRVAIIDHKTGAAMKVGDWLKDRPPDAQVPLYAAHSEVLAGAAVIARVNGDQPIYTGFWEGGEFPGRPGKLPDGRSWEEQLDLWRAQIAHLVEEFAAGDTRVFLEYTEDAAGAYAPLTRLAEQLAVLRGSLPRW